MQCRHLRRTLWALIYKRHHGGDPVTSLCTMRQHGIVTQSPKARNPSSQLRNSLLLPISPQALPSVPEFSLETQHGLACLGEGARDTEARQSLTNSYPVTHVSAPTHHVTVIYFLAWTFLWTVSLLRSRTVSLTLVSKCSRVGFLIVPLRQVF